MARCAKDYGPQKTVYNRFTCWSRLGVFNRISAALAAKGGKTDGTTNYLVDLIADGFATLAKAKAKTVEDDMQD